MRATPDPTSTVRQSDWDGRDLAGETHTAVAFVDLDLMEVRNDGSVFTPTSGSRGCGPTRRCTAPLHS